jgi:hypothetical protein
VCISADSGIDLGHCHFLYDVRKLVNICRTLDALLQGTFNYSTFEDPQVFSAARKVIQYVAYVDKADSSEGHGTHIAGSFAGSSDLCKKSSKLYNGMAQGAKIAFFDVGNESDTSSALQLPSDLSAMFDVAYDAGARIYSNSWGSYLSSWYYSSNDQQVDEYLHSTQVQ